MKSIFIPEFLMDKLKIEQEGSFISFLAPVRLIVSVPNGIKISRYDYIPNIVGEEIVIRIPVLVEKRFIFKIKIGLNLIIVYNPLNGFLKFSFENR